MKFRGFSFLYNCLLGFYGILSLPSLLIRRNKWKTILKKWGGGFNFTLPPNRPLIWIHAVSLGETKAVAPLAKLIKEECPEVFLLITSTTETGHEEAKKSISFADAWEFLPFDFSWIMRPLVHRLKPKLLLFSESDFWPHLMQAAKVEGAGIAIVNGKISERSVKRFKKLGPLLKYFFHNCDLICVQSSHYKERFRSLAYPEEKLQITGNLKLDFMGELPSTNDLKLLFGFKQEDLILVAGSTHAKEEKLILEVFKSLLPDFPTLKLILVPRHPERFQEVTELIQTYPFKCSLFSNPSQDQDARIILIDTMGLLKSFYQIATLAIVCGSFNQKVGGHNILEPCTFAKPVIFGPYMHTQKEFVELVQTYQAGLQIEENSLEKHMRMLLSNEEMRRKMGQNGLSLVKAAQGATQRTFAILKEHLFDSSHLTLADNSAKR